MIGAADRVAEAAANQRRALHPAESVWVAASAGTGKTKVLTDRLLALMLDGTDPGHILCLTFTRAAAAEMANRINQRLAAWATMAPGRLAEELVELTGQFPRQHEIARARQLFARILDVPGGARIATIHAFCQSLLRRFPLEAGVPPEFTVMDERSAAEALAEATEAMINAARSETSSSLIPTPLSRHPGEGRDPLGNPLSPSEQAEASGIDRDSTSRGTVDPGLRRDDKGGLAAALAIVARYAPEERFIELMSALAAERGKLRAALADGEPALRRRLCLALSVPQDATRDNLIAAFCASGAGDEAGLRAAAAALTQGSATDRERGAIIAGWCADPAQRPDLLDPYIAAFLTEKGEARQTLITKPAAAKASPTDPCAVLQAEAERILRFQAERAGIALIEATGAIIRLGDRLLGAYERRKLLHGLLDYDDLVLKAVALLRRPGVAPWVLFKLDGGLDHILIDEAQDTNPEQWAIVQALAEEFFAGEVAGERARTVFAVGDAKQSIYSFQRADPRDFVKMRQHFEARVAAAKQDWVEVPLDISFRAAEPLLQAVDAVFRQAGAADGVALDGRVINHVAARAGQAGLVELWPAVLPEPDAPPDAAPADVAGNRPTEPYARLARAIAATIAQWLATGERLEARGRALRPGDVMVLVRRRNAFVRELLRALKQYDVPVAGADRLVLAQEMAVQDLVALGRFLLLPEDDLTLAAVLKGPLFGLSEDDLFLLAYDRGEATLWSRLRRLAAEYPAMAAAAERLRELLARADFVPPFELYAEILGAPVVSQDSGRRAMLERLGPEAADGIEEFLALALAYEREHVPSLQGFLRWLAPAGQVRGLKAQGDIEVKRDFGERQRDEVRILTVHGAKGLEAPVVFLPDTMQLPDRQVPMLWSEAEALPLWRPRRDLAAPFYLAERDRLRRRQLQEYRRLLYVGLTRAQDRLYVCGWQTRNPVKEAPAWHALCHAGWSGTATPLPFDTRPLIGERDGWQGEMLRLSATQTAPPVRDRPLAGAVPVGPMPGWVLTPPPPEPSPPKPLLPSRPTGPEPATLSPLAVQGRDRFKRGLLVHRLLQSLPELPGSERAAAARRFLALPVHGLDQPTQAEIAAETLAVLEDPALAELWGPDARAEVPVVGLIPGASPGTEHALSGQIDRLVVTSARVLIVDFKTIRPAPATEDAVPAIYLRQLATYRAALQRIYPGRPVDCAFLWTDGPLLMPISPARLARHLPGRLMV